MDAEPVRTIPKHRFAPLVNGGVWALAIAIGFFLGIFVSGLLPGTVPVGIAISIGLVYIALVGLSVLGGRPKLDLYDDRLEYQGQSIACDDIEIIIKKSGLSDGILGTKSYKIINGKGANLTVQSLSDPGAFEQRIVEQIIDPSEQYRRRNEDSRIFWQLWPADCTDEIPEHGIVQESDLADALGVDFSDIDLDGIDEAVTLQGMDNFNEVEAAVESSGDAGAFDDSGGGADGGGFGGDGGGGGGGE